MESSGDGGLAGAGTEESTDMLRAQCRCWRPSEARSVFAGVSQTSADALTQDLAFKLGKNRKQSGHGPARWRRQIQSFS